MMETQNHLPEETNELTWPTTPSAIMIMGKRQGTKKENKQLLGRIALAAALWYSAPEPKPYLVFVASDVHGPARTPDHTVVKAELMQRYGIPSDYLIIREHSNCTLVEVRAMRTIARRYQLTHIFLLTHLYHAPRAQRYADEVLPNAAVIPVHPAILDEITFPLADEDLLPEIEAMIKTSLPSRLDVIREAGIEWLLNQAHTLDPRGRFERRLARLLRPSAYG